MESHPVVGWVSRRHPRVHGWMWYGNASASGLPVHERLLSSADMGPAEERKYCRTDDAGKSVLRAAMRACGLGFYRICLTVRNSVARHTRSGRSQYRSAMMVRSRNIRRRRLPMLY